MIKRSNKSFRNFVSCLSVCLKDPVNPINYFGLWISYSVRISHSYIVGIFPIILIKKIQTVSEFFYLIIYSGIVVVLVSFITVENKSILKNLLLKNKLW